MDQEKIESHLQDLHLTPQLPQMDQSQIESHLQDWAVVAEGEYGPFCKFEYTKGPFIQFCADTDQGRVYFTANMPICAGGPTDLPQPIRAKIVQAFEKIAATHDLKVWYDENCECYSISDVKNVKTLVECVCAVMDVAGDAYGEMEFELF